MSLLLAPSMLSANFGELDKSVELVNEGAADWLHLDIMDGLFVPNISYGFPVVKAIAKRARKPLDAHLMIVDPDRYIDTFAACGVEYLSVHYEACNHLHRTIYHIKDKGMKAGVAINPHTPVDNLKEVLSDADFFLIMSVNPGFGGQSFIPNAVSKVKRLRQMLQECGSGALIEVDGGVGVQNAAQLCAAGADILVAGSAVFGAADPLDAMRRIKGE